MTGPLDPQERAEEDRVMRATRRMIGVLEVVILLAIASLLTSWALHLARTPSSVPDVQDVQVGTVCPDPTSAP